MTFSYSFSSASISSFGALAVLWLVILIHQNLTVIRLPSPALIPMLAFWWITNQWAVRFPQRGESFLGHRLSKSWILMPFISPPSSLYNSWLASYSRGRNDAVTEAFSVCHYVWPDVRMFSLLEERFRFKPFSSLITDWNIFGIIHQNTLIERANERT